MNKPCAPNLHHVLTALRLGAVVAMLAAGCSGSADGDVSATDPGAFALSVSNKTLFMNPGDTVQLAATVSTSSAAHLYTVVWESADPGVASISVAGVATASASGTTTLTATATLVDTGATASAQVHVTVSGGAVADLGTAPPPDLAVAPPTVPASNASGYMGYAAENGGVTGGAGGEVVVVTTFAELVAAAQGSTARIIQVSGSIDGGNDLVDVGSNKSIIGLPGAELHGAGLYMFGTSNVIIQNLKMWAGDPSVHDSTGYEAWAVKDGAHNAWIDHCEMNPSPGDSAAMGHSLAAVATGADFVTVSWSTLRGQVLGLLIGSSSIGDDSAALHVTVHHCLFEDIVERQPKQYWGHGHVFNNYYKDAQTNGHTPVGITSLNGAIVRTDGNYFQNFAGAAITTTYSTEQPGFISGLDTNYKDAAGTFNATATSTWIPPYAYASYLTPVMDVPAVVLAGAGAILP